VNLLLLAARNTWQHRFRTILTVLAGAIAVTAYVALQTVLTAWSTLAAEAAEDRITTRNNVSLAIQLPRHYGPSVRAMPGVAAATWVNWFGGRYPADPTVFFASFAVDAESYFDVYREMELSPEEMKAWREDRQGAIIGDALARRLGLHVGDRITLSGTMHGGDWPFHISGIYKASRRSIDRSQFIMHWDYLNERAGAWSRDRIGWIVARVDEPGRSAELGSAIDAMFAVRDFRTLTMSERAFQLSLVTMAGDALGALDVISLIILAILALVVANTIAMNVRERSHEHGAMRAIGFRPRSIIALVVGEAFVMALLAAALGLALCYPVVELGLGRWIEENSGSVLPYFRVEWRTMLSAVAITVVSSSLAAFVPAWLASKKRVTDLLRHVG
jgi:putative ABC transport system permease protein